MIWTLLLWASLPIDCLWLACIHKQQNIQKHALKRKRRFSYTQLYWLHESEDMSVFPLEILIWTNVCLPLANKNCERKRLQVNNIQLLEFALSSSLDIVAWLHLFTLSFFYISTIVTVLYITLFQFSC